MKHNLIKKNLLVLNNQIFLIPGAQLLQQIDLQPHLLVFP